MGMVWEWITKGIFFFFGKLKDIAAGIVGKILSSFGLTIVSFEAVLPRLKEVITEQASGLSGPAMDFLGYLGVGQAMSMVLSALTVQMAWKVFIIPKTVADQLGAGS
ncbi:DUF2523 family protein [Xanthomonas hortorum]|uniref:DUF2523 family protein n=1 Tax=Xanthomonas hortorum TaxID=56454 RepID=UPI002042E2F0|nr:DUF2523 family protein [Xanthomonas hortorum]MCM5526788.1 DUF2523 domain-containing protein [Xanthomonas hortorum pv. pelargonii]MCM5538637.1 DUF2523 domain-containing protein [Xanthomonas hortorum pv. pelargonii]MCM5542927.1 DUF2523 domain-containing protein [Xanthomonas hortorum pv. pelargonii]MCM5547063.1 DUF2523 domain-containing protein [Xanthomonas hortorum pv. pelargonii]MCM5550506.1 DUF2523 domain-containing protein [Xanthomonas hortorum pv. pelargonii]